MSSDKQSFVQTEIQTNRGSDKQRFGQTEVWTNRGSDKQRFRQIKIWTQIFFFLKIGIFIFFYSSLGQVESIGILGFEIGP